MNVITSIVTALLEYYQYTYTALFQLISMRSITSMLPLPLHVLLLATTLYYRASIHFEPLFTVAHSDRQSRQAFCFPKNNHPYILFPDSENTYTCIELAYIAYHSRLKTFAVPAGTFLPSFPKNVRD